MNHNTRIYTSEGWESVSADSDPDQALIDAWMGEIDTILIDRTGHGIGYYPDIPYNDLHKAGISPIWAACIVLGVSLGLYPTDCQALRQELGI